MVGVLSGIAGTGAKLIAKNPGLALTGTVATIGGRAKYRQNMNQFRGIYGQGQQVPTPPGVG